MKGKYKIFLLCLSIMLVLCFIVSASYAYYMFGISQSGYNAIVGECFRLSFNEGDALNIGDAIPLSEEEAQEIVPFSFSIKNVCSYDMAYNINIETLENNTMDLDAIRVKLDNDESAILGSLEDNGPDYYANSNAISSKKVGTGYISTGEEKSFQIKAWIDEDATYEQSGNKMFVSKVVASAFIDNSSRLLAGKEINRILKRLGGYEPSQEEIDSFYANRDNLLEICNGTDPDFPSIYEEYCNESLEQYSDENIFYYSYRDTTIKHIVMVDELPSNIEEMNTEIISSNDSQHEVIAWLESDTVKIYSADERLLISDSSRLFQNFSSLIDVDLSKFDTSLCTDMSYMFEGMNDLESLDVSSFDTSNVTNMGSMFEGLESVESLDITNFDTSKVTDMSYMFEGMRYLESLNVDNFDTSKVTDMSGMFQGLRSLEILHVDNFDTHNVTDMSYMFNNLSFATYLNVSHFDTSNVINMSGMFKGMSSLKYFYAEDIDTSKVTDMSEMFYGCYKLPKLDLSSFNTSNVTDMSYMFSGMSALSSLKFGNNFDTSKVTSMSYMFQNLQSLISLDLSFFDTSNVEDMRYMFKGNKILVELNLSSFNTSKVKNMSYMFSSMDNIVTLDLSSFSTNSLRLSSSIQSMFSGSTSGSKLKTIYVSNKWNNTKFVSSSNVFTNLTSIVGGAGTIYDSANVSGAYAKVDGGASNPGYFTLKNS